MPDKNINSELYHIVRKYKLNVNYPEWDTYFAVIELIEKLFVEIPKDAVLAIRGAGEHTKQLLKIVNHIGMSDKIKYIVDQNPKTETLSGITVISKDEAKKKQADIWIVSSFQYRREMKTELRLDDKKAKIIDLYEYFRLNGVVITKEFYYLCSNIMYTDIFFLKENYEEERNEKEKKVFLQMLIFSFLENRDFQSTFDYMNEYINHGWDENGNYSAAKKELEELLQAIEEEIKKREDKNIIIQWMDSLPYEKSLEMSYLNKKREQGIDFKNAFSNYASTHGVMVSIFRADIAKEGTAKEYYEEKLTLQNSPLLRTLKEAGYDFKYVASPKLYRYLFEKHNYIDYECYDIRNHSNVDWSSPKLWWMAIQEKLTQKRPCCYLIHNLAETHPHFRCPSELGIFKVHADFTDEEKMRWDNSQKYFESQLAFYDRFYGEEEIQIYMSDHGIASLAHADVFHKIVMIVAGKNQKRAETSQMYSHLNFCQVIKYIITQKEEDYKAIFDDKVLYHCMDVYNKGYSQFFYNIMKSGKEDGKISYKYFAALFQYAAVRTESTLFVKYFHGKELFFVFPDEEHNRVQEEKYREVINEHRAICERILIDYKKDDYFSECEKLYELLPYIDDCIW